jgi:hypothetical protein
MRTITLAHEVSDIFYNGDGTAGMKAVTITCGTSTQKGNARGRKPCRAALPTTLTTTAAKMTLEPSYHL